MRSGLWAAAAAAAGALLLGLPARAAVVVDTLPGLGSPDWTTIQFDGTTMTAAGPYLSLTTAQSRGIWFGYGEWYGQSYGRNYPTWRPSSNSVGNHFSFTASYSSNATDWNAYFYDDAYNVGMLINPTGCLDECYNTPAQQGVQFSFGGATPSTVFVALDTTQFHTYEFLLKDGMASYRIDGVAYTGAAMSGGTSAPLLVVGDGSGTTRTGWGTMLLKKASFDSGPTDSVLVTAVPEPGAWALMIAGLGLTGAALRRRRAAAPATA